MHRKSCSLIYSGFTFSVPFTFFLLELGKSTMTKKLRLILIGVFLTLPLVGSSPAVKVNTAIPNYCLFKNPLCFYNLDVLRYLQVLHQKQLYDQMEAFFLWAYEAGAWEKS